MRRAIAAAVMSGLVLGGALGTPAFAMDHGSAKAKPAKSKPAKTKPAKTKPAKTAATKTVVFAGYELDVPASWPVYRLDENPRTCVRYDVHAVYLGSPGPDMSCPAGLVGRTEAVSVVPGRGTVAASTDAASAGLPAGRGGRALQQLSAVDATIRQNAVENELDVALGSGASGATVSGTYGTGRAAIQQVLRTLRPAPAGAADSPQWVPAQPLAGNTARSSAMRADAATAPAPVPAAQTAPSPVYTNWHGVPKSWPVEIVAPSPTPTPTPTPSNPVVGGFDTCGAPSLSNMQTFRSHYKAVGVYIGGVNSACAYGNFRPAGLRAWRPWATGCCRPTSAGRLRAGTATGR